MDFSVFTGLCNSSKSILEHFHHSKENLYALPIIPKTPSPKPYVTTNLLSVSMDLPIPNISYKWNYITCGLLYIA